MVSWCVCGEVYVSENECVCVSARISQEMCPSVSLMQFVSIWTVTLFVFALYSSKLLQ